MNWQENWQGIRSAETRTGDSRRTLDVQTQEVRHAMQGWQRKKSGYSCIAPTCWRGMADGQEGDTMGRENQSLKTANRSDVEAQGEQ
jgi:hypothetical protein